MTWNVCHSFFIMFIKQNIPAMTTAVTTWPKVWLLYCTLRVKAVFPLATDLETVFLLLVLFLFMLKERLSLSRIRKRNNLTLWWRTLTLIRCLFSTQCCISLLRVLGIVFLSSSELGYRPWLLKWDKYLRLRSEGTHSRTMPSAEKILYFLSSAMLSAIGLAVLGYGMSEVWVSSTMACSPLGSNLFNGSATIRMGLFKGIELKDSCPRFTSDEKDVPGELMISR